MIIRSKINFKYFDSFDEYTEDFPNNEIYPFVLNGNQTLSNVKFNNPAALVFGNEGEGLSHEFSKYKNSIKIEHSKEIDSLNLSTAAGVALFSLYNQRLQESN